MKKVDQILKESTIYEGVPVLNIYPGSAADKAGIKAGDILLEVNGHRTKTASDYIKAIKDSPNLDVLYVRDGVELSTTIINKRLSDEQVNELLESSGPLMEELAKPDPKPTEN